MSDEKNRASGDARPKPTSDELRRLDDALTEMGVYLRRETLTAIAERFPGLRSEAASPVQPPERARARRVYEALIAARDFIEAGDFEEKEPTLNFVYAALRDEPAPRSAEASPEEETRGQYFETLDRAIGHERTVYTRVDTGPPSNPDGDRLMHDTKIATKPVARATSRRMITMTNGDKYDAVHVFKGGMRAIICIDGAYVMVDYARGGYELSGEPARPGDELDMINALVRAMGEGSTTTVTAPDGSTTTFTDPKAVTIATEPGAEYAVKIGGGDK
jgi:hypothetical protein